MKRPRSSTWGRRVRAVSALCTVAAFAVALAVPFLFPASASAHAFLQRSDPAANAVMPAAPSLVRLWFTERIEPAFSTATLYDSQGNRVDTARAQVGEGNELVVPLPSTLPGGTYTIQWRNVSATDGHSESGYVPFTIGTQEDVVTPVVPEITQFNRPPTWVSALGRWASLLGVAVAFGALVCWLVALRPAIRGLDDEPAETVRDRAYSLAMAGVAVGVVGSLLALSVQSANAGNGYGPGGMYDVAFSTRWGQYWLARIVLLIVFAGALSLASLWDERPKTRDLLIALGTGLALLVPFALISHAAAQVVGKPAAVVTDWIHLAAASIWIGGLIALLEALVFGTRGVAGPARRAAWAEAVHRFTTLATIAVVVLVASGLYNAWLQVGNLTALRETAYGQTLIFKLALVLPMLLLGLMNKQVIGPRLRESARSGRYFGRAIAAEAMLGIGVLFAVGILTSLPPARDALTAESGATAFHWNEEEIHASLYVSPGAVGFNRYTVDTAPNAGFFPDSVEVILRFTSANALEGVREVKVPHLSGARYEASGSELSVVGDWEIDVIVRQPGVGDWRATAPLQVETEPPVSRIPGPPPRFSGGNAALAVLFAALAVIAVVIGWRMRDQYRERLTVVGFGLALLLTAGVIFGFTLAPAASAELEAAGPPLLSSPESIEAGRQLFQANCASCHGVDATGNGPNAPNLRVEPADLTAPHVNQHSDQDVHWWIRKGIGGNMPSFEGELANDEIWNLVNYIRGLSRPAE